jgi:hypothetical protein
MLEAPMYPPSTIPDTWPTEQALAVREFLEILLEGIGDIYQEQFREYSRAREQTQEFDDAQLSLQLFPSDNAFPF